MKKIFIVLTSLLGGMTGVLTSCSEDYPGPDPVDVTANYSNKFYSNSNLSLTYSGESIIGKSVDFSTVKGETANITLYDIIPGEGTLRLIDIPLTGDNDKYHFQGNGIGGETETTFSYEGQVEKGKLEINITNIKMGDSELWANNYMFPEITASTIAGSAYIDTEMAPEAENGYNSLLRGILSYFLPQLLNSVTLQEDGNIIAGYSSDPILLMGKTPAVFMEEMGQMDMGEMFVSPHLELLLKILQGIVQQSDVNLNTTGRTFEPSSTNLAYWYKNGERIMLKLNLPAVLTQIMKNSDKPIDENLIATLYEAILKIDALQIKSILTKINESINNTYIEFLTDMNDADFKQIVSWLTTGIPLNIQRTEEHTYIYVDKETLLPLFNLLPKLMPMLTDMLKNAISENIYAIVGQMIEPMLNNIATDWPASQRFNIGLDLILNTNEQ